MHELPSVEEVAIAAAKADQRIPSDVKTDAANLVIRVVEMRERQHNELIQMRLAELQELLRRVRAAIERDLYRAKWRDDR